jgi:CRISPR-associated endonuclease/helicase Cas3
MQTMRTLSLKLGSVYSRLSNDNDQKDLNTGALPVHYNLRQHQTQTWQAFSNSDADVIFDTALTGDGKSLAGQLPMLVDDRFALLLYPTNELIRDQVKQVERYLADFGRKRPHQVVYSERITEEVEKYNGTLSRSSALLGWLKNRDYILSNPDLFHLMSSYNYGSDQNKREFAYQIPSNFQYLLFDEFHIFGPPQVISVVNIMNYHKVAFPHHRLKYVFLSATPSRNFRTLLEKSGFQIKVVEGSYSPIPAQGYTAEPIVQPVALHLHSLTDGGAYAWAEEHLAEVKDFFRANERAKGVFIVNSVATAKRLVAYYRRELQGKGILRVGENTRLTDPKERLDAMENPDVQLIIATSTVDVGVDFKINLLIFESSGSGTFIQRLGRLGRHPGWNEYRAYALLPDWTVDRFASHVIDVTEVDRVKFLATVREQEEFTIVKDGEATIKPIFQPDQEYRHYTTCWGGLQTAHIVISTEKISKQWNSDFVQELRQQYNKVYSSSNKTKDWIGSQIGRYRAIANDELDSKILLELNTFRGRSPLDCGIFDVTDGCFKQYNLFFLLANTVFKPISEAQFKKMLTERDQQFERYRSRDLKLYVILEQYIEEREQFSLACSYSFKGKLNQVHVYDTFTIQDSRTLANHLDESVNDRLRELELICLVVQGNPKEFKRQNGLNPLFPVYQVKGVDGMERSIIFGLDALLAHSLVFWKSVKNEDDVDEYFIC